MIVVLISGYACAGKSTVSKFVYDELMKRNVEVYKDAFAREVKKVAYSMLWNEEKDDKGRKLLQNIGRIGREYNVDTWARILLHNYIPTFAKRFLIVDDWRYPNELDYMLKNVSKVITVRVRNDRVDLTQEMYKDSSETSLDDKSSDYDFVIQNNYSVDRLQEVSTRLVDYILEKEL